MTEQELRALVRDAVQRHLGQPGLAQPLGRGPVSRAFEDAGSHAHPSHAMYIRLVNVGEACVIEPAVTCDHCGYCKSHGH